MKLTQPTPLLTKTDWSDQSWEEYAYPEGKPPNGEVLDLNDWQVGHVTNLSWFFVDCHHPLLVSKWDVSKVNTFTGTFHSADHFDDDLSEWDVRSAVTFTSMFAKAKSFTGRGLERWNVSKGQHFERMFEGTNLQNEGIVNWAFSKSGKTVGIVWSVKNPSLTKSLANKLTPHSHKRKRSSPSSNESTPEALQYTNSRKRTQRHELALEDKRTNPQSHVLWSYLFSADSRAAFVEALKDRLHVAPHSMGGFGYVTFEDIEVPIEGATTPIILSCAVKQALNDSELYFDLLEVEFVHMYVAYRKIQPYLPFFVEPYVLIDEGHRWVEIPAFRLYKYALDVKSQTSSTCILVSQQVPNACTLNSWLNDYCDKHPTVTNEFYRSMHFFIEQTTGWFNHGDTHEDNIMLDTLGNDFTKPPSQWRHVRYQFPRHTFILPFRWYFIDLAQSQFHPSLIGKELKITFPDQTVLEPMEFTYRRPLKLQQFYRASFDETIVGQLMPRRCIHS